MKAFLAETFATRTRDEWDEWLRDKQVCYAPVYDLHEAWHQDYLRERGMVRRGEDGVEHLGTPIAFREEPGQPSARLARLGEDTDRLLAELGYDDAAVRRLHDEGVV